MNIDQNLEELFLKAKKGYYTGETIMSDEEFDILEEHLRSINSPVISIVGFDDENRNAKFNHPSKMLSLSKYQATVDGVPPTEAAVNWMKKLGFYTFESTPKFDGNAVNCIYRNGKLEAILSRGNGTAGRDYTSKLHTLVPSKIETPKNIEIIEIRGEVVIPTKTFDQKYSQFKNERNFVAGILNRDDENTEVLNELVVMGVEIRCHKFDGKMDFLPIDEYFRKWNFNHKYPLYRYIFKPESFEETYQKMLDYRLNESPFRLDGFVIKAHEDYRLELGDNDHDPNWAVAIKFPPQEANTIISNIQWNFGKTGEYTPIAVMEPTSLDGTIVSRATMFNYGYVKKNGCFPGAEVTIAKSGDIIPQIVKVVNPNNNHDKNWHPTHCEKCGTELVIDDIHLICPNDLCEGKSYYKFINGFNQLGVDGSGGAAIEKLWNAGFTRAIDILDKEKFNYKNLIKSGEFKEGKTLKKLVEQVYAISEIKLNSLILMLGFDGMGSKTSVEVAKKIANQKFNFSGLEKRVVDGFENNQEKRNIVENAIELLKNNNIQIIYPEVFSDNDITFEMTGSTKAFGYKTKNEFINYLKNKGYRHTGLKEAKILFTDDLSSSSSKMKEATKRGVIIKLYDDVTI